MKKEFYKWHRLKEKLHRNKKQNSFREGEIWYCSLGANIGYEIDGKHGLFERPVVIFKKFNNNMFWGLPLTTKFKKSKWHFKFYFEVKRQPRRLNSFAIFSQMRLLDQRRLIRKSGIVHEKIFNILHQKFNNLNFHEEIGPIQ